ncbi:methyltransferase domain-containing protein [Streptomyces vinaceus]
MTAPGCGAPDSSVLVDGLLAAVAAQFGRPVPARLREAFHRLPRHQFLPDRIWVRDGAGGYEPLDRATEPARWMAAAYEDQPLVTQFTGGLPSSSASMPSMVVRMLLLAGFSEPPPGEQDTGVRVLELGAGTGYNAGLLCALAGDRQVTTVELDPALAAAAEERLKTAGYAPAVVAADAASGWQPAAPFDLVLATFSVDHIPPAWLAQTRPGGRIVTPWTSSWCSYGTLALTAGPHGRAEGRFHPFASFMPMARPDTVAPRPVTEMAAAGGAGAGEHSSTTLSPWTVAGGDLDAEFHVGLTVPGACFAWDTSGEHAHTRLQVADMATGSRATIDYDGRTAADFAVAQAGARLLWDEITTAYRGWEQLGRPSVDRYGLTTSGHTTTAWLDSPTATVAEL